MATPFGSTAWHLRSNIPGIGLNGTYSGIVIGPLAAVHDKDTKVIQVFNKQAHHFTGFTNTAQSSTDDGKSWVTTFNAAADLSLDEVAFNGWSLPSPTGVGKLHFQVRWHWKKHFLIADGTSEIGGIALYVSTDGVSFQFHQQLHSWPQHLAIPGGSGGAALMTTFPNCTQPILIEGSGPDGEDAYWMVSSFSFDAGGTSNRQTFKAATLWRSIDGGITWEDVRDLEPDLGVAAPFSEFIRSDTGRLFLNRTTSVVYTDDADDLINATFLSSNGLGSAVRGTLVQMYGGTLLTHRHGTLIAAGDALVSCDDGANFASTGVDVVPGQQIGHLLKLGPTEALIVAPGFSDPLTETVSHYTDDGGETFQTSDVWLASTVGESPSMMSIRTDGTPIVVTRAGNCYTSSDRARGVAGTRTICPLANAGLAAARPLLLCGNALANDHCTDD